jgi:hypothetical protein
VGLHLSEPAPFVWRSQGKQGKKISGSGSIIVVSRGTEHSVSFPNSVKRILVNLEPNVLQQAFPDHDTARDLELIPQWGCRIRRLSTSFARSKQTRSWRSRR